LDSRIVLSEQSESKDWLLYMPFFVYILRSTSKELYIGQTNNLDHREKQQINKTEKAAKFIKDGKEFQLVYHEIFPTRLEAMRRELQLKHWTRAKKEALINGDLVKLKILSKSRHQKIHD
jgi:predicted GIY-YIG superfamily endonuclease